MRVDLRVYAMVTIQVLLSSNIRESLKARLQIFHLISAFCFFIVYGWPLDRIQSKPLGHWTIHSLTGLLLFLSFVRVAKKSLMQDDRVLFFLALSKEANSQTLFLVTFLSRRSGTQRITYISYQRSINSTWKVNAFRSPEINIWIHYLKLYCS